jgi:hypothetical protein
MGADVNCIDPKRARRTFPPAVTSSLVAAMREYNAATLRTLVEAGADVGILKNLLWDLEKNDLPEASGDNEEAKKIKQRLDAGAEILKILREAGFRVPGTSGGDDGMSFYGVNFVASSDGDRYCEGLAEFESEYSFPCYGTRPGALWHAASPKGLELMIDAGADVNARDAAGWTAMHHIAYHCVGDYYFGPNAMLKLLIDSGADINARGRYGLTPLLLAAGLVRRHTRAIETVKLLLRNGADFEAEDDKGRSVFYWIRNSPPARTRAV